MHLALKKLLPDFGEPALNSLMLLVLTKMFNRRSALFWIPWDRAHIDNLTLCSSQLWDYDISIADPRFMGLVRRLASSDGALILSSVGQVIRFGAVANLTDACAKSVVISGAGAYCRPVFGPIRSGNQGFGRWCGQSLYQRCVVLDIVESNSGLGGFE
jgi:hypothetical protein